MNVVYVLVETGDLGNQILSVHSTLSGAEKALETHRQEYLATDAGQKWPDCSYWRVEEHELEG